LLTSASGIVLLTRPVEAFVPGWSDPTTNPNRGWRDFVEVTITGGYTEATLPAHVRRVLLLQLQFMQQRHDSKVVAVNYYSAGKGGAQTFMDADYHPAFKQLAGSLRRDV
jgi:hypothetical protein